MKINLKNLNSSVVLSDKECVFMPSKRTRALSNEITKFSLKGKSVLDMGCGSGFLAILSKILGAKDVVASDILPNAIHATRKNWKMNAVLIV